MKAFSRLYAMVVFAGVLSHGFLTVAHVHAEPPKVEIPDTIKPVGDYAVWSPKTNAKAVTFIGMSGVEPFPAQFLQDKRAFILPTRGLKQGEYLFRGVASLNDEHTLFSFRVVVGSDVSPEPKPKPEPGPNPPPVEYDAPVWVYIVEESANRTPATSLIINDLAFWKRLCEQGYNYRVYDKDSEDAKSRKLTGIAAYPYVVFVDNAGNRIRTITMPQTKDGLTKELPIIRK